LVAQGGAGAGRLAAARVTLVGTCTEVDAAAQEAATARYLDVHPGAFWARFPDFAVHRLDIEAIRFVRGFGEMGWVEPDAFATAEPDPVAPGELAVMRDWRSGASGSDSCSNRPPMPATPWSRCFAQPRRPADPDPVVQDQAGCRSRSRRRWSGTAGFEVAPTTSSSSNRCVAAAISSTAAWNAGWLTADGAR
jgi:hypothetical protein